MIRFGNSVYKVEYLESVAQSDVKKLSRKDKNRIKKAIEERLVQDPVSFGKPLQYSFKGCRCMRVGSYRVVFKLETKIILIVKIGHRKDIYKLK